MLDVLLDGVGRFIGNFVFGTILEFVFYWPGWVMLRLITLGKYPPTPQNKHNRTGVAWFGLVAIITIMAVYTQLL